MLKVVTPAEDTRLISVEGMRVAAGVASTDASRDADLTPLAHRLSLEVVTACRVAVANGGEPTLRQETLEETFRNQRTSALMLARRHKVEIVSVQISGTLLPSTLYWVDEESGIARLANGAWWSASQIVVTYQAGFAEIPADLEGAVGDFARIRLAEGVRDPLVKGESMEVPGVLSQRTDYWVGGVPGAKAGGLPVQVFSQLRRYKNVAFV